MNAEDLNDICGRAVRGAPIDADHVLEIIADLAAAEAAIARVRELCDDLHPFCKGGHVLDAVRDAATIERT